jgi:hypothetical protein
MRRERCPIPGPMCARQTGLEAPWSFLVARNGETTHAEVVGRLFEPLTQGNACLAGAHTR